MDDVDDVSLNRVGIVVLQLEHLFDSMFFESGKADEETERSGKIFTQYHILLAPDLSS